MAVNVTIDKLENVTNELLEAVRELEYSIVHFMKKTNKSTALEVRNVSREAQKLQKEFKNISISYYKDGGDDGK